MLDNTKDSNYIWKLEVGDLKNIMVYWYYDVKNN